MRWAAGCRLHLGSSRATWPTKRPGPAALRDSPLWAVHPEVVDDRSEAGSDRSGASAADGARLYPVCGISRSNAVGGLDVRRKRDGWMGERGSG
jgi:hypothetical protein